MDTRFLRPAQVLEAAAILRDGGVAAVPTETVYGLAANALSGEAVEKIFAAKGRPEHKPVSIFVTGMEMAERFCRDIPGGAYRLAEAFWPGPLTVILRRRENVPDAVTAGGGGVGVRVPDHETALALLRLTDLPLTGTSANLSGQAPTRTGAEAFSIFKGRIDCVVDGEAPGGVPSTVVDLTGERAKILRFGAISAQALEKVLGEVVEC